MKIVSSAGASTIGGKDGEDYRPDDNGEFDVPEDLAAHLLKFPGWHKVGDELPVSRMSIEQRVERLESGYADLRETVSALEELLTSGKHSK